YSALTKSEITLAVAQETLHDVFGPRERSVTVEMIQKSVADHFHMRVSDLKAKNNSKAVAVPRQVAMYLCKKMTNFSLPHIGREFGGKHHTTVLHSVNKIDLLRNQDGALNNLIQSLMEL